MSSILILYQEVLWRWSFIEPCAWNAEFVWADLAKGSFLAEAAQALLMWRSIVIKKTMCNLWICSFWRDNAQTRHCNSCYAIMTFWKCFHFRQKMLLSSELCHFFLKTIWMFPRVLAQLRDVAGTHLETSEGFFHKLAYVSWCWKARLSINRGCNWFFVVVHHCSFSCRGPFPGFFLKNYIFLREATCQLDASSSTQATVGVEWMSYFNQ